MIGLLVQWGPVLLLIALMLVLDTHVSDDPHASVDENSLDTAPIPELAAGVSTDGAIQLSESFDPWAFDNSGDIGGDSALGLGEAETVPDEDWLEDPAAFYWGPAIVDEFPPAPDSSSTQ